MQVSVFSRLFSKKSLLCGNSRFYENSSSRCKEARVYLDPWRSVSATSPSQSSAMARQIDVCSKLCLSLLSDPQEDAVVTIVGSGRIGTAFTGMSPFPTVFLSDVIFIFSLCSVEGSSKGRNSVI